MVSENHSSNKDKELKIIKDIPIMDKSENIFESLEAREKENKRESNIALDLLVNQQKNRNKSSVSSHDHINITKNENSSYIYDEIEEQKINNDDFHNSYSDHNINQVKLDKSDKNDDNISFRSYTSNKKSNSEDRKKRHQFEMNYISNKTPKLISQEDLDKVSEQVISNNSNYNISNVKLNVNKNTETNTFKVPKTYEEIRREKEELLYKFEKLKRLGIKLPRSYNMTSNINEMREDYDRLKKTRETENGIKFSRKMLVACTTGIEFLNNRFDPFDIKLDGWSESVHENINEYDEVFEELYEKYNTDTKIAPELKLMFMIGGSAFMFHLTNTMLKSSMPGMGDIMKQNPDLMKQFASAAMGSMGSMNPLGNNTDDLDNIPMPKDNKQMKGPTGVDDILKELGSESTSVSENDFPNMKDVCSIPEFK